MTMERSSYASLAISNGYLAELGLFGLTELGTGVLSEATFGGAWPGRKRPRC